MSIIIIMIYPLIKTRFNEISEQFKIRPANNMRRKNNNMRPESGNPKQILRLQNNMDNGNYNNNNQNNKNRNN